MVRDFLGVTVLVLLQFSVDGMGKFTLYPIGPLLPSIPHEAVITALGREASIRCASELGEKPPNTTACTAPIRAIANIAKMAAGIIGTRQH